MSNEQDDQRVNVRRFLLVRDVDVTGVSGTGVVAEGVEFTDGVVAVRWRAAGEGGVKPTTVIHDGITSVIVLHGHDGRTRVEWLDGEGDA